MGSAWRWRGCWRHAGRGTHVVIAAWNLTANETMRQAATSQPTSLTGAYRSTSSCTYYYSNHAHLIVQVLSGIAKTIQVQVQRDGSLNHE